ncbi:MAG: site-specific DNA-methyltransferase [Selenomonadaceae bacterium]|nr:site-specific DNA-methyltransferase [Selenomonadaceae bacterium]
MIELDSIYNMDCLEGMKQIPDGTIDAVICDLPFGTTDNPWDVLIPFDKLWEAYWRILKPNGAVLLFGQEPFASHCRLSSPYFRYDWIWRKPMGAGFMNAKKMPLRAHEVIMVFYKSLPTYNPQFTKGKPYKAINDSWSKTYTPEGKERVPTVTVSDGRRYPVDVLDFQGANNGPLKNGQPNTIHPTQKPVDLLRYLVLTYTNEGDTVLDNCMGSGTTAIACIKERRHFIGFELSKEYFDKAVKRIDTERRQLTLF